MDFESSSNSSELYSVSTNQTNGSSELDQLIDQIYQRQNQILGEAKNIEDFIEDNTRKRKQSPSFSTLKTLFSLFKSELQLNLSLRKAIIQEKNTNQSALAQVSEMVIQNSKILNKIEKIAGYKFQTLDKAVDFTITNIKSLSKTIQSFEKAQDKQNICKTENKNLKKQVEELQNQMQEIQAQGFLDLAQMQAKVDQATENYQTFQQHLLLQQKSEIERITSQMQIKQNQISQELVKQQEDNMANTAIIQQLTRDNEALKGSLTSVTKERDDLLQKSQVSSSSSVASSDVSASHYQEILTEFRNAFESKKDKIKKLKAEKIKLIQEINDQRTTNEASVGQIIELERKVQILESKYRKKIKESANRDKYERILKENQDQIEQIEMLRDENYRYSTENEQLISQLRSSKRTINALEADNAKLTAVLDRLRGEVNLIKSAMNKRQNTKNREEDMIIDAFNRIRDGLKIDKNWNATKVANFILSQTKDEPEPSQRTDSDTASIASYSTTASVSTYNSEAGSCGNTLQAQIDSLQNEVESLRSEVSKYV